MGRIRPCWWWGVGGADGGASPRHVCFFLGGWEKNNGSPLLQEGKGIWVDGQLAGSVPRTRLVLVWPVWPVLARPCTHTPQSTGTGLGLIIYQAFINKTKKEEWEK